MKKILLIAAVALCSMGCCKKAAKCQETPCCDQPAVECCQKVDSCCAEAACQATDSCCQATEECPKADCPKADTCPKKVAE